MQSHLKISSLKSTCLSYMSDIEVITTATHCELPGKRQFERWTTFLQDPHVIFGCKGNPRQKIWFFHYYTVNNSAHVPVAFKAYSCVILKFSKWTYWNC